MISNISNFLYFDFMTIEKIHFIDLHSLGKVTIKKQYNILLTSYFFQIYT